MKTIRQIIVVAAISLVAPGVLAGAEKDCLLKGTVVHGEGAGQDGTRVQIHSVSRYDDDARCRVRSGQKMQFKLPADPRLDEAPSGSEVQYRYRSDGSGESNAELLSIGT